MLLHISQVCSALWDRVWELQQVAALSLAAVLQEGTSDIQEEKD